MRERLIELLKGVEAKVTEMISSPLALEEWLGIYADHLLANGVIVPSVKVGDILHLPTEYGDIIDYEVETILYGANNEVKKINCCHYYCDGSGYYTTFRIEDIMYRSLYRSREEAEAKLKEGVPE